MNLLQSKKKILTLEAKAFSILEVLIMLVVISLTIISAMALVSKASVNIKNNETLDLVNNVLFKSIELLKSPSPVYLDHAGATQIRNFVTQYYTLKEDPSGLKYLAYKVGGGVTDLASCDPTDISNFYHYNITAGTPETYNLCLQVVILPIRISATKTYYDISTNVKYTLNGTTTVDTLKTFRYDGFISIP